MLVFSIDISLVIMFFKVFEKIMMEVLHVLYKKKHFTKNLHFNNISNVHHIETTEHFLTSEEDKQLHTQIQHYCLTFKNVVACTTEVFMLGVTILPIFLLYHFDHTTFWSHSVLQMKQFQWMTFKITFMSFSSMM